MGRQVGISNPTLLQLQTSFVPIYIGLWNRNLHFSCANSLKVGMADLAICWYASALIVSPNPLWKIVSASEGSWIDRDILHNTHATSNNIFERIFSPRDDETRKDQYNRRRRRSTIVDSLRDGETATDKREQGSDSNFENICCKAHFGGWDVGHRRGGATICSEEDDAWACLEKRRHWKQRCKSSQGISIPSNGSCILLK